MTTGPAVSMDSVSSPTSAGSIDWLTTLRLDSPDWRLVEEGRQESIGAQAADGGLIGGHYSVYDAPDGQTQIHLVVWPVDESRSLTLLRFWDARVQIMDVGGTAIGYSPAGAGMPATAWWLDGRGYLVMSTVTTPSDVASMRRILVEGPTV
ncbi:MAG: hypothetical protein ACOYN0_18980 [Phycisphaerales bacterium]